MVTVEEDSSFPEFKADASCSSEPQSLIAEYFLDCQPGSLDPAPQRADPGGPQQDHGPARPRPEHPARAVPGPPPAADQRVRHRARRQRREPERRDPRRRPRPPAAQAGPEHPRQPEHARSPSSTRTRTRSSPSSPTGARTSSTSSTTPAGPQRSRPSARDDLAQNFHLLDDFLVQLKPTMFQLGQARRAADPAARPTCTRPRRASTSWRRTCRPSTTAPSSRSPRSAARRASARSRSRNAQGRDRGSRPGEHQGLPRRRPGRQVPGEHRRPAATRSRRTPAPASTSASSRARPTGGSRRSTRRSGSTLHGDQTGTVQVGERPQPGPNPNGGNPGYTGMEGLLNYAYVQTNSLNLFDKLGPRARHHAGERTGR